MKRESKARKTHDLLTEMQREPLQPRHALKNDCKARSADVDAAADVQITQAPDARRDKPEGSVVWELVRRRVGGELSEVVFRLEGGVRWRSAFRTLPRRSEESISDPDLKLALLTVSVRCVSWVGETLSQLGI